MKNGNRVRRYPVCVCVEMGEFENKPALFSLFLSLFRKIYRSFPLGWTPFLTFSGEPLNNAFKVHINIEAHSYLGWTSIPHNSFSSPTSIRMYHHACSYRMRVGRRRSLLALSLSLTLACSPLLREPGSICACVHYVMIVRKRDGRQLSFPPLRQSAPDWSAPPMASSRIPT